jgi:hypothetical protein
MGLNMSASTFVPYLDTSSCCDNICPCSIFIVKRKGVANKVVLLNALVPVSDKPAIIISIPITVEEAKTLIKNAEKIESYIGHEATAKLLSVIFEREISMSRGMYIPQNEDIAIVVRLRKRLEKPEDVKNVKLEDIEFLLVRYYTRVEVVEYK